jgi:hypothetical protein
MPEIGMSSLMSGEGKRSATATPRLSSTLPLNRCTEVLNRQKVLLQERLLAKQRSSPVLTECNPTLFEFVPVEGRQVVVAFDGGAITSGAGALLLGETDGTIRLTARFAACFTDARTRRPSWTIATASHERRRAKALACHCIVAAR